MKNKKKKFSFLKNSWLYSDNQIFLNNIYEKFLNKSKKIDKSWQKKFKNIEYKNSILEKNHVYINQIFNKQINLKNNYFQQDRSNNNASIHEKFLYLMNSFRTLGHHLADTDPLKSIEKKNIIELSLSYYHIQQHEMKNPINTFLFPYKIYFPSYDEAYNILKKTYCKFIGFEYMHLYNMNEKIWLQKYIEKKTYYYKPSKKTKKNIITGLIQSETFESFMHTKFPGNKRFSLEGCDVLIPILKKIIQYGIRYNTKKIVLGMAHRGRLNVMHNIFKYNIPKMYQNLSFSNEKLDNTGDVKYHLGAIRKIKKKSHEIELILLDNPSHLEIISPVILGMCKSFIDSNRIDSATSNEIIPIIIHGDAAFTGQGITQETLNMSQVPGYCVFGSIHIIINNQIGFTTSKKKYLQSNIYCTDVAKMIDSPIFHVNADRPESVMFVIKLALKFRFIFKKDVFIDLVCYRRLGHNEVDDPSITQPVIYKKIKNHKKILDIYLRKINKSHNQYTKISQDFYILCKRNLNNCLTKKVIKRNTLNQNIIDVLQNKNNITEKFKSFSFSQLIKKMIHILQIPKDFLLHYQVQKIFDNRLKMIQGNKKWDWGSVEILAYANLILRGINCRLSGEDVRRGTFSHRHAAIYCQKTGRVHIPLKKLNNADGGVFHVWDSVLSEAATVAFEYGYSIVKNFSVNIWEAQFGDFVNGAQVVIDQFIVSGQQKWGHNSSLILMLPHGYEGQGPEHSSARIERFLQLCAQKNIRICIPTITSQIYYMIQKQGMNHIRKPLIIFTPKSLLRKLETFCTLEELSTGFFQKILLHEQNISFNKIKKIIFCSGKIYYDLLKYYQKKQVNNLLIIRLEQLYPFPKKDIKNIIQKTIFIKYCLWCQEEPQNQGAWVFFYFYFKKYITNVFQNIKLKYVGRPKWASTAEGNLFTHRKIQYNIIRQAFENF